MTDEQKAELKEYLRQHLRIEIVPSFNYDPIAGVEVKLLLEGEVISGDTTSIPHDHPDWREQR